MPSMTASSSSNTSISTSNGAIPNEVVCEEEELDFDKWRVHNIVCLAEQKPCRIISSEAVLHAHRTCQNLLGKDLESASG